MAPARTPPKPDLPSRQGTSTDPSSPREIENPGDPGPTVLVPPERDDPRDPPAPGAPRPQPGI